MGIITKQNTNTRPAEALAKAERYVGITTYQKTKARPAEALAKADTTIFYSILSFSKTKSPEKFEIQNRLIISSS